MELDELRSDWRSLSGDTQLPPGPVVPSGKRGRSPVRSMLRNLNAEALFVVVMYGFIIAYYFRAFEGMMKEISWFMLVIGLVFLVYYVFKSRLLRSLEAMDGSLQANIESKLDALTRYTRFYVWAGTLLGPITMIFIGWLAWYKLPVISPGNFFYTSSETPWWKALLSWLVLGIPLTIGLYYINVWYVDKLYGRHLRRLRQIQDDMHMEQNPNLPL